ncbi:MAG: corrinoid protein [bacterium]|nr:corrinoid protein [bacterium]
MSIVNEISEALLVGNAAKVKELTEKALGEGVSPKDIIQQGLIPGMGVVGVKFKNNEYYVPEVLIAARAMHAGLNIVKPMLADSGMEPVGRIAIGTVKGDLHDIGKNLVAMMLEGAGFDVNDLGIDVTADKFVEVVKDGSVDVIAMSALLTTTMPSMADTIKALEAAGLRDKVKIMIGGAPVTQNYADEIGADGYSADAASAVDTAKELMGV